MGTDRVLDADLGLVALEGERVLLEVRPRRYVRWALLYTALSLAFPIVTLPLIPLVLLIAFPFVRLAAGRARCWLTDRRVITASGVIGYRVRSIPLERISDVVLQRSVFELAAGTTSLVIRDMTGETLSGAVWCAIDDAPMIQKRVLEEVSRVNVGAV